MWHNRNHIFGAWNNHQRPVHTAWLTSRLFPKINNEPATCLWWHFSKITQKRQIATKTQIESSRSFASAICISALEYHIVIIWRRKWQRNSISLLNMSGVKKINLKRSLKNILEYLWSNEIFSTTIQCLKSMKLTPSVFGLLKSF